MTEARYDEAANRWHVATETGARYDATFLIAAAGCLSSANIPDIPGLVGSRASGITPGNGRVFATGFDAMTGPLLRMNIHGRQGLSLRQAWQEGPRTYLGLQVAGFPNLFTITGPGSPSVLCNMPVAIEQHVEWITACIDHMRRHGLARIEPAPEAADRWVAHVNDAANATLLAKRSSLTWALGSTAASSPSIGWSGPVSTSLFQRSARPSSSP